ncbi:MAG: NUDIX hydrolase [Vicinamibacterales bacterium]
MPSISRSYPSRPFVGVGAVVVDDGRVLLVKRGRPPLMGEWSLPGGAVEVGETLTAAIQREVFEETGLVVAVGPIVDVLDRIHTDGDGRVEFHYVLIDYLCAVVGGSLHPQSDADDACWASRDELAAFQLQPLTRQVVGKALDLTIGQA